jgi:muramidase (phage lysozyme)
MNYLSDFFETILKGESKTYNDHNYYTSGGLKGFIEGGYGNKYSLLDKPLSEHTIGEVIAFQNKGRDTTGQLWATGRYQIIPSTLKGVVSKLKLPLTTKYDKKTQDLMGLSLLTERKPISDYVQSKNEDNKANLENAAKSVAMIWSSVGVPYDMQGSRQKVLKNQSYYSGGGDKASVKTELVQEKLKQIRKNWGNLNTDGGTPSGEKKKLVNIILIGLALIGGWVLTRTLMNKSIIPKF